MAYLLFTVRSHDRGGTTAVVGRKGGQFTLALRAVTPVPPRMRVVPRWGLTRRRAASTHTEVEDGAASRGAGGPVRAQAATHVRARAHCDHSSDSACTRWSMSASVWTGDGVMRSRSVPLGTVGN